MWCRAIARVVAFSIVVIGAGRLAGAEQAVALLPPPSAVPLISTPQTGGGATSCVNSCQSRHDQCRVSTKGAPGCDSDRQRCLEGCLTKRQR